MFIYICSIKTILLTYISFTVSIQTQRKGKTVVTINKSESRTYIYLPFSKFIRLEVLLCLSKDPNKSRKKTLYERIPYLIHYLQQQGWHST